MDVIDERQFTEIVNRNKDTVYRTALIYTKNITDAEDISQEVFIKLWQSDKEFESAEHTKYWLIRTTINAAKDLLKNSWHSKREDSETLKNAVTAFETNEESEIYNAVCNLKEKYRIVIHLFYYEEYSIKEIAELTGEKETTIQTRLMRARRKLKEYIEKKGG